MGCPDKIGIAGCAFLFLFLCKQKRKEKKIIITKIRNFHFTDLTHKSLPDNFSILHFNRTIRYIRQCIIMRYDQ